MSGIVSKLNRLQQMGWSEVAGRSRQEFSKLTDRWIPRGGQRSDAELYGLFRPDCRNGSAEGSAELMLDRMRREGVLPLAPFRGTAGTAREIERRFPAHRDRLIEEADRACAGRFDLLGFRDLDFGSPVDWHFDPVTSARSPLVHWTLIDSVAPIGKGDLKVFWEIHRTAHCVTLAQARALTGEDRYAEALTDRIVDWIETNPYGMGIGWAASLDCSFRAISWLWAVGLCIESERIGSGFMVRMIKSLIDHGRHIEKYLSVYFSPNTHLTGEALGLFCLGLALPELAEAERWKSLGLRILLERLPQHVRSDGVYFEQASYYHRYTMDFYLHLDALLAGAGIELPAKERDLLRGRLEAMGDHLMWIRRPDGTWPLFGDDDGGRLLRLSDRRANDFGDTLAIGAALLDKPEWKLTEAPPEMLWFPGEEAIRRYDDLARVEPAGEARIFEQSGYAVIRDGWERRSDYLLVDCGPHGAGDGCGHAHSDGLSFELAFDGVTWLVDPGTFVYGSQPEIRDWFRSTEAHNTATVDGQGQSLPASPFSWRNTVDCRLDRFVDDGETVILTASHDGFRRLPDPVVHERTFFMNRKRGFLIVDDRFIANDIHRYALRFHLAADRSAEAAGSGFTARDQEENELAIICFIDGETIDSPQRRVELKMVSTCYGASAEADVAILEVAGSGLIRVTTIFRHQSADGNRQPGASIRAEQ